MPVRPPEPTPPLILVVDDDRGLLRLIEKTLRREGYAVSTAASGAEALEWLGRNRADLMLLDLKLQDLEGKELINHLDAVDRRTPFVIITGQGDERVAVEMMKRGALDYLVKDVRFQEFVPTVVKRALEWLAQQEKLAAAEYALAVSEVRYRRLFETAQDGILLLDAETGQINEANQFMLDLLGFSLAEIVGKKLWEIGAFKDVAASRAAFRKLQKMGYVRYEDLPLETKDGRQIAVEFVSNVYPEDSRKVIQCNVRNITERKRLEQEVLNISDREQRRIGQDLHDGLGQQLTGIELMSRVLEQRLAGRSKADARHAAEIARYVRESIHQTRMLARGLSPVELEAEGLMSALRELATNTGNLFKVKCEFICRTPVLLEDHAAATHLFRIAQEAVSNSIRHGKASRVLIQLGFTEGKIILVVKDFGAGFAKTPSGKPGMGLRIMQYRAGMIGGSLAIQHNADGVTVLCTVRKPTGGNP